MAETDPKKLADRLEQEAGELERHSRELGERTDDVSQEWRRKRADPNIPGAPPPPPESENEPEDEESTPTGSPTGKGDGDSGNDG